MTGHSDDDWKPCQDPLSLKKDLIMLTTQRLLASESEWLHSFHNDPPQDLKPRG